MPEFYSSDVTGASPCTSIGLNPDHTEISESKLDDKNIVETIVQMVQLEFLELELIEQEQKVIPSISHQTYRIIID